MKRVLVVDDDESIRSIVADLLEYAGYEVITAQNGAQALDLVRALQPDAVILDLMMPVLDGWGFLKACRKEEWCASIPVLVLSAYRQLAEVAQDDLRVSDFLAKPFEIQALLKAVKGLLA